MMQYNTNMQKKIQGCTVQTRHIEISHLNMFMLVEQVY